MSFLFNIGKQKGCTDPLYHTVSFASLVTEGTVNYTYYVVCSWYNWKSRRAMNTLCSTDNSLTCSTQVYFYIIMRSSGVRKIVHEWSLNAQPPDLCDAWFSIKVSDQPRSRTYAGAYPKEVTFQTVLLLVLITSTYI